jgi:hypothetical protein
LFYYLGLENFFSLTMPVINRSIVVTIGTLIALAGCATPTPAPVREAFPNLETRHIPELNAIGKAELGDSMVSTESVSRVRGLSIAETVSEAVNPPGTTSVVRGDFELFSSRSEGDYYQGTSTYSMLGTSISASERSGVFLPSDKTKPAVIYHYALGYKYGTKPIAYVPKEIIKITPESFRRELIYSGVSQNTVTLVYREFKDSFARPAFTQELKYDLSQNRIIGYKGARFEVLNAGNTEITYKVISLLQ